MNVQRFTQAFMNLSGTSSLSFMVSVRFSKSRFAIVHIVQLWYLKPESEI